MNQINKKVNIEIEVARGEESLKAAEVLLAQKLWYDSISRSYYAAFHFVQALLLTLGLEARSHQGLQNLFSLHFVKKGIFETKYAHILSKAQKFREESDYDSASVFTQEDALERLNEVKELIQKIRIHLG